MSKDLFVRVDEVMKDCDITKSASYKIIKNLNSALKEKHPEAIIIRGRVNRQWYEQCCLRKGEKL